MNALLLEQVVEAAAAASRHNQRRTQEILEKALASLSAASSAQAALGGLAPWPAKRISAYIREHIGTSLRSGDLASLVRLSRSHFSRAFKTSFQETPTAYIMRLRVEVAQHKMRSTGHSLSQIALECGLADQSHLCRMFRRIVGQTPHLWRRQFSPAGAWELPAVDSGRTVKRPAMEITRTLYSQSAIGAGA
jgi:AraC family transcriptional regulator